MSGFPTQDEIVARIRGRLREDPLGFETGELLDWCDFEHAREFLKPDATAGAWAELGRPYAATRERVLKAVHDYMPFAWEKANDCRGISAWRSLEHMRAWLWLLGGREREMAGHLSLYSHYGKPQLRAICEHLDIDWQSLDDGCWRNDEGEACSPPLAAAEF